ncbi:MAG: hypothetical protein M3432_05220 [Chloroflexota bacterium]|nr:hypothetical protein [Chloroflexota bacterium]
METAGQLRALQTLGCELGQGYVFARALEPEAVDRFAGSLQPDTSAPRRRAMARSSRPTRVGPVAAAP